MLDIKKILMSGVITLGVFGCSEPEPQVIDIDEAAANVGLAPGDYEVHENGAIEIKASESDNHIESKEPLAAQGEQWQYIANNGIRTAEEYAVENNPSSTFIGNDVSTSLVKQYGGKYEGEYLLTILNDSPNNISYAQLRPLFDIESASDSLDDEGKLWEVTTAKYNGIAF